MPILALLAKTGIHRNELITLDTDDIYLIDMKIRRKVTASRSNRLVFLDGETALLLGRWLKTSDLRNKKGIKELFLNAEVDQLDRGGILCVVRQAAKRVGLHDPSSERMEDHFSPHCARHWYTTYLLRAGMKREYVQWLRGDAIKEAVDIYFHVDPRDVQDDYMASIPQLGI
jgi:integrase/recombinase XerD